MWTSNIVEKTFANGIFTVNVSYTNGSDEFNEVYINKIGTELDGTIASRLDQLNSLETYVKSDVLQIGVYTPQLKTNTLSEPLIP